MPESKQLKPTIAIKITQYQRKWLNNFCPHPVDPVPTFNQPIASGISTQPSGYKRAERNLQVYLKGPQHGIQVVDWVIHLHIFIDLLAAAAKSARN